MGFNSFIHGVSKVGSAIGDGAKAAYHGVKPIASSVYHEAAPIVEHVGERAGKLFDHTVDNLINVEDGIGQLFKPSNLIIAVAAIGVIYVVSMRAAKSQGASG